MKCSQDKFQQGTSTPKFALQGKHERDLEEAARKEEVRRGSVLREERE